MLKKPVVTEVRTPTNTWSGLGFSKSMPAETIKELRRANHVSYKPTMSTTYEVRTAASYSPSCSRNGFSDCPELSRRNPNLLMSTESAENVIDCIFSDEEINRQFVQSLYLILEFRVKTNLSDVLRSVN